jgi:hypothetical protein
MELKQLSPPLLWALKSLLILSLFALSACVSQSAKYTPPPAELVAKITATNWLKNMDNGGTTCASGGIKSVKDRRDCHWVEASLLPPLDITKRQHFGQKYDPEKYFQCNMRRDRSGSCSIYKLRRIEQDPVWPYPDVPAIKWPSAPEKETYQRGMSSKTYFDALCKAEAGKFICRTVDNVEGIYQVRPRVVQQGGQLKDRYVMEDPAFQMVTEDENMNMGRRYLHLPHSTGQYFYWETSLYEREWRVWELKRHHPSVLDKPPAEAKFIHYAPATGEDFDANRPENISKKYDTHLKSHYGYVWRGIQRPHDRENSIGGSELAVIDLQTNEILGLWREFARTGKKDGHIWWLVPQTCSGIGRLKYLPLNFFMEILKPAIKTNNLQGEQ